MLFSPPEIFLIQMGNFEGSFAVFTDVSSRKQAEQELRESEEKFRNLFNNVEVGMFRTRLDGSEILDMNEKFLNIFGRTREEMQGLPSVIHWADPSEREEMLRMLEIEGRVLNVECKMLNKQGEVRTCLASSRLYRDQGFMEGSIVDITARIQAEEALRESEEKYRTLLETTSEGCWLLNREVKTIEVNAALCKMLGYSQDEMLGKTPLDFVDDKNRKVFIEQTSKISNTKHHSYEIVLKKKNGEDLHTYF